nr:OmpA family protein [Pedobacter panaciterrae]
MKARLIKNRIVLGSIMLFMLLNALGFGANAQYVIKEADQQFEHYNYSEAVKSYLKAWKKKEKPYTAQRIAESYQKMSDYKSAEEWYARLSAMAGSNPESRLWYADALRSQGKYAEAKTQYQQYGQQQNTAPAAQIQTLIASCDSAIAWTAAPKDIKIENLTKINGNASDWAAVKYKDGIVFTSDRTSDLLKSTVKSRPFLKFDGTKLPDRRIYQWTGNPYTHLYYMEGDQLSLFPLGDSNDYHIGTASFTADGKEAYFTMTRIKSKKDFKQPLNTIYVGLYSSRLVDGKWTDPEAFRYTDDRKWSVGDPFISPDGQTLYFVSDMQGGLGGTDIYKCSRYPDGKWSDAVNLGAPVNSSGNERSPFVYEDNLFFSSDGHVGMGGLDIYKIKDGKVVNLGFPMNSGHDDFAFQMTDNSSGFLSSNREKGSGKDDVYSFTFMPEVVVMPPPPIAIEPAPEEKKPDSLYIEIIYYNFDKANIRNDATVILDKVASRMQQNPNLNLVMSAHTDSKGTKEYNLHLSQSRARSAVKYLTDRGISASRIEAKGYGESLPAAENTFKNGKDNPAGRQLNRRTEIKMILK